jgi:phosphopantetheinyl transferase
MLSSYRVPPITAVSPEAAVLPGVYGVRIPPRFAELNAFEWLSDEDAARSARITSATRRAQFAAGRWLLKHAAEDVFGGARYALHTVDERPVLSHADGAPAAVSLSHSGDRVLCAIGRVRAVGVDVECVRPRADWSRLADWALHPKEQDRLAGEQRWESFYQVWTLKEALAKALGVGVFDLPFHKIALSEDDTVEEAPASCGIDACAWQLRRLDCGKGVAAALAWRL